MSKEVATLTTEELTLRYTDSSQTLEAHSQQIKTLFENYKAQERRVDGALRRIDEQAKVQNSINMLDIAIEKLSGTLERHADHFEALRSDISEIKADVKVLDTRMDDIEHKPAQRWDGFIKAMIAAFAGGIGGAILIILARQIVGG